jgi:hypothetical protein
MYILIPVEGASQGSLWEWPTILEGPGLPPNILLVGQLSLVRWYVYG